MEKKLLCNAITPINNLRDPKYRHMPCIIETINQMFGKLQGVAV